MGLSTVIVTALCLAGVFTGCAALQCFVCMQNLQEQDKGCGDHFSAPNSNAEYCSGSCLKRRGEHYSNDVRYVDVYRTCTTQQDDGCHDTVFNGMEMEVCACNTDYCNASQPSYSAPRGAFLQLVLALAVWLINLLASCLR